MANQKITDLTALVGTGVDPTADVLPIVDVSADETKKIIVNQLVVGMGVDQYQSTWNATTNSPTLATGVGTKGFYYLVATAGTTTLDGISSWAVGDIAWFNGTAWEKTSSIPSGSAGGDLGSTYPNPTVTGLGGNALPSNAANGFLKRNSGNSAWEEVAYGSAANTVTVGNDSRLSDSRAPNGSAGGDLTGTYPNPTIAAVAVTAPKVAAGIYRVGCVFDGGGSAVAVGSSAPFVAKAAGTIIAVYVLSDISTTAVIDIWKTNADIPTVSNTITASAKPTLTAASYLNDTTFTSWTTSVSANDVFRVHVDSNNNATQISVIIVIG